MIAWAMNRRLQTVNFIVIVKQHFWPQVVIACFREAALLEDGQLLILMLFLTTFVAGLGMRGQLTLLLNAANNFSP